MHPPSFAPYLHQHKPRRLDDDEQLALDSSWEMPPPYQPDVFPARAHPRKGAPPSPLATPPPYCSSTITPGSPDSLIEDDPHYLATPTQRAYFVGLTSMFEEQAMTKMPFGEAAVPEFESRKRGAS